MMAVVIVAMLAATSTGPVGADEGLWPRAAIGKALPLERLRAAGWKLGVDDLASDAAPSLDDAVVQIATMQQGQTVRLGTASFVSKTGLLLTSRTGMNEVLSVQSLPDRPIIEDGYAAKTQGEELICDNVFLRYPTTRRDVTDEVRSGQETATTSIERERRVRRNIEAMLARARSAGQDAEVHALDDGLRYEFVEHARIRDVRLVYVPPRRAADFGAHFAASTWPRHSADFIVLRAYVADDGTVAEPSLANVPFVPSRALSMSLRGARPDDACFVLGFPAATYRRRSSHSLAFWRDVNLPAQAEALRGQVTELERLQPTADAAMKYRMAGPLQALRTRLKQTLGTLEGIEAFRIVERRREREAAWTKWIGEDVDRSARLGSVLQDYDDLYRAVRRDGSMRKILADLGSRSLFAMYYVGLSRTFDRDRPADQRRLSPARVASVTGVLLNRFGSQELDRQRTETTTALAPLFTVPRSEWPKAVADVIGTARSSQELVDRLMAKPLGRDRIQAIIDVAPSEVENPKSDLDRFGFALARESRDVEGRVLEFGARVDALRHDYFRSRAEMTGKRAAPDADGTLRLSLGRVTGYAPREAVTYGARTSITGLLERSSRREPWRLPEGLEDKVARGFGRYGEGDDAKLIVNFVTDADSGSGSSGSVVLDGEGVMVGMVFDRNSEALASDFDYDPRRCRTICVDTRYVLWTIEHGAGMKHVVDEMDVRGG